MWFNLEHETFMAKAYSKIFLKIVRSQSINISLGQKLLDRWMKCKSSHFALNYYFKKNLYEFSYSGNNIFVPRSTWFTSCPHSFFCVRTDRFWFIGSHLKGRCSINIYFYFFLFYKLWTIIIYFFSLFLLSFILS